MNRLAHFLTALQVTVLVACSSPEEIEPPKPLPAAPLESVSGRPNILLIVADDLGFTDLGSFGSEISTPHLDQLAMEGMRFSQFYTAPTCSTTRAMLLTGVDHHLVGFGVMGTPMAAENQKGQPGYEGYLKQNAANMGELFLDAGYHTYVTGKWHLGEDVQQSPPAFGFQRSFIQVHGGGGHFNELPAMPGRRRGSFRSDGKPARLPDAFYSSDFYVDTMISYLRQDQDSGRPFLAYLAMTAPHWPLQAKQETIAKYEQMYLDGYEALAEKRRSKQMELGITDYNINPPPYENDERRPWATLDDDEKAYEARRMAVYAAMIDDMDNAIGRLLEHVESTGQLENTVIIFMSDNGAAGNQLEGMNLVTIVRLGTLFGIPCCNNDYDNMGNADSFIFSSPQWAQASVGSHRIYKGFPTEGGILAPAFVWTPGTEHKGDIVSEFVSVKDILPTVLDLASITPPGKNYNGRDVLPIEGKSMAPLLQGKTTTVHGNEFVMGWELFSKHAVRNGDWKLLKMPAPYGDGQWKLYNLANDPGELTDLAASEPEKLKHMIKKWQDYERESNVIIGEGGKFIY